MTDSASAHLPVHGSLMRGKRGLVMGVANDRSLAWGIASACAAQGAELAFTFQGDALERRVRPLAAQTGSDLVIPCDVAEEPSIDAAFAPWPNAGTVSTSSSTPSDTPTNNICADATSTPRGRHSCRRWTSPAIRSRRSANARCR